MGGLVLLLLGIAFATVGVTGYVIFGPLTCRHLQDRGQAGLMAGSSLSPTGLLWILRGGYGQLGDAGLRALALPARIMLILTLAGVFLLVLRWLLVQA
ncbi:hypothetical protein [Pseudofulvimonas gallinarii]|nr:hypothetical protein [Pseudofulvimonas gallinarii]THD12890.1 hypothetical protein B1808_11370 [Pseudofulvimonas gallinarii]